VFRQFSPKEYCTQQKVLCNWGSTLQQSSAVHIQALYSADGILPGSSSKLQHLVINLASVPGRQLVNSPTAQSLERNTQAKDLASGSFHVCGVLTLSFYNTFRLSNVPLLQAIGLPLAAFVTLRFGQVERN